VTAPEPPTVTPGPPGGPGEPGAPRAAPAGAGWHGSPLLQLTMTKIREFLREPEALFWVFAFPLILAVALGLAFRDKPPDRVLVGIVSGDGAPAAAAAIARSTVLLGRILPLAEAREALHAGKISLLVDANGAASAAAPHALAPLPPVAPPRLPPAAASKGVSSGAAPDPGAAATPPVRAAVFRYDPTRPDAHIASLEAKEALERAAGRADIVTVRTEKVTEKGSRYIDFLIPGLLGMNLMGTGIWSLAFSITTARQRHLLKRLIATPMHRGQYLLAQILGRLVFLVPEIIFLVSVGWLAFGVVVHGSLLLLLASCLLGAMAFCGLGLLIASRVRTVEGASGWANLVMMPMWLLSGVFFSSERFPERLQPIIHALPLTAFIDALRGIINDGRSLSAVAAQLAIVAAWGLASFLIALRIFRWR
jgi:ABC-2 type transport system permease protein